MVWFQSCLQFADDGDLEVFACGTISKTAMLDVPVTLVIDNHSEF